MVLILHPTRLPGAWELLRWMPLAAFLPGWAWREASASSSRMLQLLGMVVPAAAAMHPAIGGLLEPWLRGVLPGVTHLVMFWLLATGGLFAAHAGGHRSMLLLGAGNMILAGATTDLILRPVDWVMLLGLLQLSLLARMRPELPGRTLMALASGLTLSTLAVAIVIFVTSPVAGGAVKWVVSALPIQPGGSWPRLKNGQQVVLQGTGTGARTGASGPGGLEGEPEGARWAQEGESGAEGGEGEAHLAGRSTGTGEGTGTGRGTGRGRGSGEGTGTGRGTGRGTGEGTGTGRGSGEGTGTGAATQGASAGAEGGAGREGARGGGSRGGEGEGLLSRGGEGAGQEQGQGQGGGVLSARLEMSSKGGRGDTVLLEVEAAEGEYLRLAVYDRYDGKAWLQAQAPAATVPVRERTVTARVAGGRDFDQTIHVVEYAGRQLPVPYGFARLIEPWATGRPVRLEAGWIPSFEQPLRSGERFAVTCRRGGTPMSPTELETESQVAVPDVVSARVRALASQLSTGGGNLAPRLEAISRHLWSTCRYDADFTKPSGPDLIDDFLFRTHEGICGNFAGAAALILRLQGIPARVVGGFLPGARDPSRGRFLVRGRDMHAWCEVFDARRGWLLYDPTPAGGATPLAGAGGGGPASHQLGRPAGFAKASAGGAASGSSDGGESGMGGAPQSSAAGAAGGAAAAGDRSHTAPAGGQGERSPHGSESEGGTAARSGRTVTAGNAAGGGTAGADAARPGERSPEEARRASTGTGDPGQEAPAGSASSEEGSRLPADSRNNGHPDAVGRASAGPEASAPGAQDVAAARPSTGAGTEDGSPSSSGSGRSSGGSPGSTAAGTASDRDPRKSARDSDARKIPTDPREAPSPAPGSPADAASSAATPDRGSSPIPPPAPSDPGSQLRQSRKDLVEFVRANARSLTIGFGLITLGLMLWRRLVARRDGQSDSFLDRALVRLGLRAVERHWYGRVTGKLARMGIARESWETPYEFQERVAQRMVLPELEALTDIYVRSRYSHQPLSPEEVTEVTSLSRRILIQLGERGGV